MQAVDQATRKVDAVMMDNERSVTELNDQMKSIAAIIFMPSAATVSFRAG